MGQHVAHVVLMLCMNDMYVCMNDVETCMNDVFIFLFLCERMGG